MAFTYWLPGEDGQKIECGTDSNSVVIIGANGSGKSKLGAWIEQQSFESVHRVGAQRNLNFNENISLKSYEQAEDLVFYGTADKSSQGNKGYRWSWVKYTTKLMDDFENVLAALIALKNNENDAFVSACKKAEQEGRHLPQTPTTSIDKLQLIWNEVFPQRQLRVQDAKFLAVFEKDGVEQQYSANGMSDGERSVLYLSAQVLCVPENKILIVDEPEIHLHRSLMNRLWTTLERFRPDCLFIYITHDTQFAAMHSHADKIWIREYDGEKWIFEQLSHSELPEDLLLDILGNRNPVLFVEGEKNSYDTQLYSALYPNYYVIPCGSCTQVIARTKVFGANLALHHCNVYGIIDRDFRSEYEIKKYKENNIYTVNVAEIENMFSVEELIKVIAAHMGKAPDEVFSAIKSYVIDMRFKNQLQGQICQSVVAQLKFRLASADIAKASEDDAKNSLTTLLGSIDYEQIKTEQSEIFQSALSESYASVIKVFNEKGIAKSVGHFFGLNDQNYCPLVLALLNTKEKREAIINALAPYLPTEIPR